MGLLLNRTIMSDGERINVQRGPAGVDWLKVSARGPLEAVRLRNGAYLAVYFSLFRERCETGIRLKVSASSLQYQGGPERESWIFRYDYLRNPENHYPAAHLHVRARFCDQAETGHGTSVENIHFPTDRWKLESVIQLLIEEFGIEPAVEYWRALLAGAAAPFDKIAHRPVMVA